MYKIGIVGAGAVADLHAQAVASLPNAQLTGCCDGGSGRAKVLADQYGAIAFANYQALIESPEVDVAHCHPQRASPATSYFGGRGGQAGSL